MDYNDTLQAFQHWVIKNVDLDNPRSKLKLEHTYYVVEMAEYIAYSLKLPDEEITLAKIIALLHDIGRFTQAQDYMSFREDIPNINHAQLADVILFENGLIQKFVSDLKDTFIIRQAIINHSAYEVDFSQLSNREQLHTKILRDADKLDSFRVKLQYDMELMANVSSKDLEKTMISDEVYQMFIEKKTILSTIRKTPIDIWVSYIALVFGLYYPCSYAYVKENHFVEKMVHKYHYQHLITDMKMNELQMIALAFIDEHLV